MGWIITGKGLHQDTTELARYTPDLKRDPFHVFMTKWHWVPQAVVGGILLGTGYAICGAFGAASFGTGGGFFRGVFRLHTTWLWTSATRVSVSRRCPTRE